MLQLLREIFVFILWMGIFPVLTGLLPAYYIGRRKLQPVLIWCCGFFIMLGAFEIPATICIIFRLTLTHLTIVSLLLLMMLSVLGIFFLMLKEPEERRLSFHKKMGKEEKFLWGIFFLLLIFTMVLSVMMMTTDGDDAYYLGSALQAVRTGYLYLVDPYTGVFRNELDYRHILSPFPMFIAVMGDMMGIHTTILAHVLLPLVLIPASFAIWGLSGKIFFKANPDRLPVFMILLVLFTLFGNYSVYTRETFLLGRTWQGKSIIANMVLPMAFYLMLTLGEHVQEQRRDYYDGKLRLSHTAVASLLLLGAVNLTGILCSSMGILLTPVLELVYMVIIALREKSFKVILGGLLPLIPVAVYGLLYMTEKGWIILLQNMYQL